MVALSIHVFSHYLDFLNLFFWFSDSSEFILNTAFICTRLIRLHQITRYGCTRYGYGLYEISLLSNTFHGNSFFLQIQLWISCKFLNKFTFSFNFLLLIIYYLNYFMHYSSLELFIFYLHPHSIIKLHIVLNIMIHLSFRHKCIIIFYAYEKTEHSWCKRKALMFFDGVTIYGRGGPYLNYNRCSPKESLYHTKNEKTGIIYFNYSQFIIKLKLDKTINWTSHKSRQS